ncbi:MAG: MtnX-like HAD-IB family phosphatase [Ignavibacteria bacterium]|nr:MtnX-like HAD-IB family phosphatase [Ignavibacteria bacterium]
MMKKYLLKIFSDFDGTISKNDVWINSIGKFISDKKKFDSILEDFYSQKIGTREVSKRQLELVSNFTIEEFNKCLDEEEIDDYFKEFVSYCRENEFEVKILSSGLEYYIDYILKREGLKLEYYGSKLIVDEINKKISCEYEYTDEYCKSCETCKRNILINNTNDFENEISVYIGDGVSDYCVSGFADVVFAKGKLASYSWKNNITYFEYKYFSDIIYNIIKMISENKFKQRLEARLRRKDVFLGG